MLPDLTRQSEVLPGSIEHVPREGQPAHTGLRQIPGRPGPGEAQRTARLCRTKRGRTSVPAPRTPPALGSLRPAAGCPAGTGPLFSPAAAPSAPPGDRSAAAAGRARPGRGSARLPTASAPGPARRCRGCGGTQPGYPHYSPHGYPASPWRHRDPAPPPAAALAQPRALPRARETAAPLGPERPRSCGSGDGGGHTAPPAGAAPLRAGPALAASARPAPPRAAPARPRAPGGRKGWAGEFYCRVSGGAVGTQNHKMGQVGRGHSSSSGPTSLIKRGRLRAHDR